MKHAINLPAIGEMANPSAIIDIAQAADENGWDGFFLWDNMLFENDGKPIPVLDPWLLLGCVASHTSRIRLGPMVTPLPSRRVSQIARSATTLDALSDGRLTLGFGLGSDERGELSVFGENLVPRSRAETLDASLDALNRLWTQEGTTVRQGPVQLQNVTMLPKPVQKPRIPIWLGSSTGRRRPVSRAAKYDGIFPINISPDELARIVEQVEGERGSLEDFDIAVAVTPSLRLRDYAQHGATWGVHSFWHTHKPAQVLRVVSRPPEESRAAK